MGKQAQQLLLPMDDVSSGGARETTPLVDHSYGPLNSSLADNDNDDATKPRTNGNNLGLINGVVVPW